MNVPTIDVLARRTSALHDRRRSLATVAASVLAVAIPALRTDAAHRKSNCGKRARQKCQQQALDCQNAVEQFCSGNQTCVDTALPCCDLVATCQISAAIACLLAPSPCAPWCVDC
jgi:hypothetical protein